MAILSCSDCGTVFDLPDDHTTTDCWDALKRQRDEVQAKFKALQQVSLRMYPQGYGGQAYEERREKINDRNN